MSTRNRSLSKALAAVGLAMGLGLAGPALGQETQEAATYAVVGPPACINNKGETVRFIVTGEGRGGLAAGMANRDGSGEPVVFRSHYGYAPPEMQSFIDRHECAHHQTGDVDRPHPPRNSREHLMNESISDCVAILRLRDEEGYDQAAFDRVAAALRKDMENIGFPEISITSRLSNMQNCFDKYGAPQAFVEGILEQRGLNQD